MSFLGTFEEKLVFWGKKLIQIVRRIKSIMILRTEKTNIVLLTKQDLDPNTYYFHH
jgi:hypothetical protein